LTSYLLCPVAVVRAKNPIQGDLDRYRFIRRTARSWIRIFPIIDSRGLSCLGVILLMVILRAFYPRARTCHSATTGLLLNALGTSRRQLSNDHVRRSLSAENKIFLPVLVLSPGLVNVSLSSCREGFVVMVYDYLHPPTTGWRGHLMVLSSHSHGRSFEDDTISSSEGR